MNALRKFRNNVTVSIVLFIIAAILACLGHEWLSIWSFIAAFCVSLVEINADENIFE